MPDMTLKTFDELDNYEGKFLYAARSLGVTAWGMSIERLPAAWDGYPEHDHAEDGQEEVFIVLEGDAELTVDGETFKLEPGNLARVGPAPKRHLVPGADGVTLLAIGGTPGKAYEPKS